MSKELDEILTKVGTPWEGEREKGITIRPRNRAPQVTTTHCWYDEVNTCIESLSLMTHTETAGKECQGDFLKVKRGGHYKPHWSKGRY